MAAPDAAHTVESSSDCSTHLACSGQDVAAPLSDVQADGVGSLHANAVALRLSKHADYQRAYKTSRKQFSSSMTYFCAPQLEFQGGNYPRVGITAGRVLGNAVERNRIKRRLREAIRANQSLLPAGVDVILHPRRSVLAMDYTELRLEIGRIFTKVAGSQAAGSESGDVKLAGDKTSADPGSRR